MPELKLAKLPDRKPVKITFSASPELNTKLQEYAKSYQQTYGEDEEIDELIPYMLDQFLTSDRAFKRAQKGETGRTGRNGASRKAI
jgi:hypothetical protein